MLTDAELAGLRSTSESALPDTCTINRPATGGTLNTATGQWTPSSATEIYDGACRIRPVTSADQSVVFGDEQITRQRYVGTFPHDITRLRIDDVVTVTDSSDPDIDQRTFRVVVVSSGSFHIDRRAGLEVVE